jgi:cytoskeleton protein RodZ
MSETAAPRPTPRSIGERLRAGRERAGLSVAAAAEKLHLDPKVIEALEADRFAELGASVYVRGHLRRYADFVGEPARDGQAYSAREAQPPPPDLTQIPHAEHRSDPRRLISPLVGLGCALVLALAIWWVLAGSQSGVLEPGRRRRRRAAATPAPPAPARAARRSASRVPRHRAPRRAPGRGRRTRRRRRGRSAAARQTTLRLELTSESWVEVYDSRGERCSTTSPVPAACRASKAGRPARGARQCRAVSVQVDGQSREIPPCASTAKARVSS